MKLQLMSIARLGSALVVVAVLAACSKDGGLAPSAQPVAPSDAALAFDKGTPTATYLVKFKSGGITAARASVASLGATVGREIGSYNLLYVTGLSDAAAASLATQPGMTVVRDRLVQWVPNPSTVAPTFLQATNAPKASGTNQSGAQFFSTYQWGLKVTRADQTWTPSNGGGGETVCVLDTGIDPGHNDLVGAVDLSRSFSAILVPRFASDLVLDDYHFHGSFTAAQIRSNGIGTASVAPNSTLCAIKVLSEDGGGTFGDIIFGIFVAGKLGADVINMSLGGYIQATDPANAPLLTILQEIIDGTRNNGTVIVAASGNGGFNMADLFALIGFIHVPSMMNNVLSVGATGPYQQQNFDQVTGYSNYGTGGGVDVVAPGGNGGLPGGVLADFQLSVCSRFAFGGACAAGNFYLFGNGTSFASPMVAGAAAVVESNVGSMTSAAVEKCLLTTASYINGGTLSKYGKGRLDVRAASKCSGK